MEKVPLFSAFSLNALSGTINVLSELSKSIFFFFRFFPIFCQQYLRGCCFYRVFTWGWGVHGQLGHHSVEDCHTPTLVERLIGKVSCHGNSFINPSLLTCINTWWLRHYESSNNCWLNLILTVKASKIYRLWRNVLKNMYLKLVYTFSVCFLFSNRETWTGVVTFLMGTVAHKEWTVFWVKHM